MIVFKTTFPDGKIYIGQSVHNKPNYFGSGRAVQPIIRQVGKKNLKKDILQYCSTQKELNDIEGFFIAKFDATNPDIGYNRMKKSTGSGAHSESSKAIMRKKLKESYKRGRVPYMLGRIHPLKGTKRTIQQIEASRIGHCRKVVQLDVYGNFIKEWSSLKAVYDQLRLRIANILNNFGNAKMAGGYRWFYKEDYDSGNYYIDHSIKINNKRAIIQLDNLGNKIAEFDSVKETASYMNVSKMLICIACKNSNKLIKNTKFMYKSSYNTLVINK